MACVVVIYGDPWPTQERSILWKPEVMKPFKYQTAYWYGRRAGVNTASNTEGFITSSVSLTDCFHVYRVIWSKDSLTYMLDGQTVIIKTGGTISNFIRK